MLPLLSNLLSRILIDRKNGHRRAVLASFREKQRVAGLSAKEQERYRDEKLAALLNHSRERVTFWREKMEGVGEITAGNAMEILKTLPMMERGEIQENRKRFEAGESVQCSVFGVRGRAGENFQRSMFPPEADPPSEGNSQLSSDGLSNSSSKSKIQNPSSFALRATADKKSKMGVVEDATGGSSGTPMRFLVDRATQIARESSLYWADSLAGWNYGDRIAMLWGSDRDVGNAKKDPKLEFRWWIDNRRWFNAFNMGEDRMAGFHRALMRFRPHLIVAYAGSLEVYARYLEERVVEGETGTVKGSRFKVKGEEAGTVKGFRLRKAYGGQARFKVKGEEGEHDLRPKTVDYRQDEGEAVEGPRLNYDGENRGTSAPSTLNLEPSTLNYPLTALVSSAEVLTPQARELIEGVFGLTVFNRYGNREFGALAAEDGMGGLVVNPVDCIVEIDSPDPFNVPGAIMVTYLWNEAMPFIRYNTGDLGVWVEGEEGRRIARIQGRQGDTIRTKGGKLIHGEYFTHLMYDAAGVKEFQFVQERIDFFRLRVVSEPQSEAVEQAWRRKIIEALGEDAEIVVEYVEEIPVLSSGKRKFTISLV